MITGQMGKQAGKINEGKEPDWKVRAYMRECRNRVKERLVP